MKGDENLPIPAGFRILLKPREIQEKTSGGIILADTTKEWQKHATNISKVISMGPECYGEKEKYWCKIVIGYLLENMLVVNLSMIMKIIPLLMMMKSLQWLKNQKKYH